MEIEYKINTLPELTQIINVYNSSGINRPIRDLDRIKQMYEHANLIITAWDDDTLVGIARSLTDFCYCCYLSDLAISREYQHRGIGKKLVELTKEEVGEKTSLILVSAPTATDFYVNIGMEHIESGFMIKRKG